MSTKQPHSGGPEDLVQKLGELLPGFEARVDNARNAVAVRGTLKITAHVSQEYLYLPAADDERVNAETAGNIADECRRLAIEATGMEQLIVARETEARKKGFEEGRKFSESAREDEIELAKFFDRHEKQLDQTRIYPVGCSCGFYAPRGDHSAHLAKELVAYLRGESK